MRLFIIGVYDLKAEIWSRPMFLPNIGGAIRSFTDEVNRPAENNEYFKHPGDYVMYHVGYWDDETMKFDTMDNHRLLIAGSEARAMGERNAAADPRAVQSAQ